MSEREKILDKLKKMYAHAKSAEAIGSEAEAHAFATKVQELLSQYKIELSEIEYRKLDEVDPVKRIFVNFRGAGITVKKRRIGWQEELAHVVCQAYFCKFIVCSGTSELIFAGRGSDLEAAEQVFLYLVRVASNMADKEYVKYFYECRNLGAVELARGFRSSYLNGFTMRLGERYNEERQKMKVKNASSGTALVRLTDALKVVENFVSNSMKTKKVHSVGLKSEEHAEGYLRGRKDANKLPIGSNTRQVEK